MVNGKFERYQSTSDSRVDENFCKWEVGRYHTKSGESRGKNEIFSKESNDFEPDKFLRICVSSLAKYNKAVFEMTLPSELSISWLIRDKEIQFWIDSGRCLRPLYIVNPEDQRPYIRTKHVNRLADDNVTRF